MKVNPIGIQSYQQLNRRENQPSGMITPEKTDKAVQEKMTIAPQDETQSSKVAVKVKAGNYAEYLSPEEKNALDLLFARFKDADRFGGNYKRDVESNTKQKTLGNMVDVKV